jgi:hypothetical protein
MTATIHPLPVIPGQATPDPAAIRELAELLIKGGVPSQAAFLFHPALEPEMERVSAESPEAPADPRWALLLDPPARTALARVRDESVRMILQAARR